jgi:hypothetical protein
MLQGWELSKHEKFEAKLFAAGSENNIDFDDLITYLEKQPDLVKRSGKHRQGVIFACPRKLERLGGIGFILNLQPDRNGKAKAYQVREARTFLKLLVEENEKAKRGSKEQRKS